MQVVIKQGVCQRRREVVTVLPTFTDNGDLFLELTLERKHGQSAESVLLHLSPSDLATPGIVALLQLVDRGR